MKKINKLNNKGFAMTGVLYMSLLIFLILIVSLLNMFLSRKNVLDKLKDNAISAVTPYPVYYNGMPVYYNPETGAKCTEEEYNNNSDKLGKTGCLKWYTFNDNDSSPTVNMILDHNTTGAVAWNSTGSNTEMKEVKESLENDITTWNNDVKTTARLISADEIAQITNNVTWSTKTSNSWFYLDSNDQTQISTSQGSSKYAWLFDYTNGCTSYGCNINESSNVSANYGYWTSDSVYDTTNISWLVHYDGSLNKRIVTNGSNYGLRPVITVSKSSVSYPKYDNGAIVYFNPDTGLECSASEAVTTPGTKTGCMKWYIFNDNSASSTVNMILDHNTSSPIAWNSSGDNTNGMNEVQIQLTTDTSSWVSGLNPRLIKADEVVKIVNNDNWNSSSATTDDWFFLEDNSQETPNLSQGEAKYNWLFNQLLNCDQYGCSNTGGANYSGYWTSTGVVNDSTKAWIISAYGKLVSIDANHTGHSGVRPVITISKSLLTNAVQAIKFGYSTDNLIVHLDGLIAPIDNVWIDQSGKGNNANLININNTTNSGYQDNGILLDGIDDDFNINLNESIFANSNITIQLIFTNYDLTKVGLFSTSDDWGNGFVSHLWNNSGELYIGSDCQTGHDNDSRFTPTDINYNIPINELIKLTYMYNGNTKSARLIISTVQGKVIDVKKTFVLEPSEIQMFKASLNSTTELANNKYSQILIYNRVLTDAEIEQNYKIDKIRFGI